MDRSILRSDLIRIGHQACVTLCASQTFYDHDHLASILRRQNVVGLIKVLSFPTSLMAYEGNGLEPECTTKQSLPAILLQQFANR